MTRAAARPARSRREGERAPRRATRAQGAHDDQLIREQAARAAAEAAEQRFAFLAAASSVLASSLDYGTTLRSVARLAVPTLADLCVVDMVEQDGAIRRLAAAVSDPAKEPLARELQERYPVDPHRPRGVPTVLRTGQPVVHPEISEELLAAVARDEAHLRLLRQLGFRSTMLVPLAARGRTLGVITFVRGEAGPPYAERDLLLAQDLAGHCALAIENARFYGAQLAARERLEALSRRLVEVQEAERRRLARELHDELGQALTGLKLLLEMARRQASPDRGAARTERKGLRTEDEGARGGVGWDRPDGPAVTEMLGEAQALVGTLLGQVRALSLELRPAVLDDLGLLPALLWHLERYTQQTGIRVAFSHRDIDRRFPPEVETTAYRIVQEALTNVARHAGVDEARVDVWRTADRLHVHVEDQGKGFDPEAALASGATVGLAGMRERPAFLGGELALDSAPGAGTRLTATLPLEGAGAEPL